MAALTASPLRTFEGLRSVSASARPQAAKVVPRSRRSVTTRAGFIGSPENLIVVASTTAFLTAGRFGLAPVFLMDMGEPQTAKRTATPGLKLVPQEPGLLTGDPAGFTAVDVLALGSLGHVAAVGIILGLRATGKL